MVKRSRVIVTVAVVLAIFACYVLKLMEYQLVEGESYRTNSSATTFSKVQINSARGEILDRYGRVLASNNISYNILIEQALFPSKTKKQNDELLILTQILKSEGETWEDSLPVSSTAPYTFTGTKYVRKQLITKYNAKVKNTKYKSLAQNASAEAVMKALKKLYKTSGYSEAQQRTILGIRCTMILNDYSWTGVYTFAKNVSQNTVTTIEERSASLKGTYAQKSYSRTYTNGTIAPHVVGTMGKITEKELAYYTGKKYSYTVDDYVGKSGIEGSMETYLHGKSGTEEIMQNSNGDVTGTTIKSAAKAGDNVVLTIDEDLQTAVQNAIPEVIQTIENQSEGRTDWGSNVQGAAAVVLNIKTGEVLAMASYPTFNLTTYNKDCSKLYQDPKSPLLSRAVYSQYRPGSTFKPITATAGLMYGLINGSEILNFDPVKYFGDYKGTDDNGAYFSGTVGKALACSSNIYFDTLGWNLGMKRLEYVATHFFQLGQKTGIELNEESTGSMSGYAYDKAHDLPSPTDQPADVCQAAIGQLDTGLTPIQMANYVSTLVKNGTQYQVHIVKQINNSDNTKVLVNNSTPTVKSKNYISSDVVNVVKEGMKEVTQSDSGTALSIWQDFHMAVGGKTGTAQYESSTESHYNGVWICFAPYDDPELAVAVVVEHGHNGYQTGPVARAAITQYYNLTYNGYEKASLATTTQTGMLLK